MSDANADTSTDQGQGKADAGDKGGDAGKTGDEGGKQSVLASGEAGKDDGKGGEQGSGDAKSVLGGASEAELKIELPEGVEIDAKMLEGFTGAAKEAGLDSKSASAVAAWYAGQVKGQAEANTKAVEKQSDVWADELSKDVNFGGKNLAVSSAAARRAILQFGGQNLADQLHDMGLGNHPGLCRAFSRVGAAIGEDTTHVDTAGAGGTDNAQDAKTKRLAQLYPKSQSEGSG